MEDVRWAWNVNSDGGTMTESNGVVSREYLTTVAKFTMNLGSNLSSVKCTSSDSN